MTKVDELDLELLRALNNDARKSYREIGDKIGAVEGTVYNRVKKLKKIGVIRRFIPDIDYSKLGYKMMAVMGVVVEGGKLNRVESELAKDPGVTAIYEVTGEYDVVVVAKFKDREGLNDLVKWISRLDYVRHTYTMLVLNTVKEAHGVEL